MKVNADSSLSFFFFFCYPHKLERTCYPSSPPWQKGITEIINVSYAFCHGQAACTYQVFALDTQYNSCIDDITN